MGRSWTEKQECSNTIGLLFEAIATYCYVTTSSLIFCCLLQAGFESSPVSEIYGGLLRSSVQMQGSKESVTVEPFFTLKLDIQVIIASVLHAVEADR